MATNQSQSDDADSDERVYYYVEHSDIGDASPGDVVSLQPSVAEQFDDNLTELDASDSDAARAEAEDLAQSRGEPVQRGSDGEPDFDADAGTFVVQSSPVGGVQPGETVDLSPEVAEAFRDNLRPATDDGADETADSESEFDTGEPEETTFPGEFGSAAAFVDRTPLSDVEDDLETGEYDDHLEDIREAEKANKNRDGVLEAIDERPNA